MEAKDDKQESIDNWDTGSDGGSAALDPDRCEVLVLDGGSVGRNRYAAPARCLEAIDASKGAIGGTVSQINISDPERLIDARLDGAVTGACSIGKGSIHVRIDKFPLSDLEDLSDAYDGAEIVFVDNLSVLGTDASELRDAIDVLVRESRPLYVLNGNLNIHDGNKESVVKLLDCLDSSGSDLKQEAARKEFLDSVPAEERRHDGRPPAFFNVEDGKLVPGEDYDDAVEALREVKYNGKSKAAAARHLGVSRRTIGRCLERPFLYCLD